MNKGDGNEAATDKHGFGGVTYIATRELLGIGCLCMTQCSSSAILLQIGGKTPTSGGSRIANIGGETPSFGGTSSIGGKISTEE